MRILLLVLLAGAALAVAEAGVYRFGVVPQYDLRRMAAIWQPVLDDLARRTGLEFELVRSPQIPDFERDYESGQFDFAYMNPYQAVRATRHHGYLPLVRDRRKLQGILVVRRDSRYRTPTDLGGAVILFPAPNALAASLLIRADLTRRFRIAFEPSYVTTHSLVYIGVAAGSAAAGGGVQETFDAQPAELRERLRVIHRTPELPAHPIMAHARVPGADRERVRDALLAMGASEQGRAKLARIPIDVVAAADAADCQWLETLDLDEFVVPSTPPAP